ncbi:hypothetical protein PSPO01_08917 [Paraphaeosphaeria sporulosa]
MELLNVPNELFKHIVHELLVDVGSKGDEREEFVESLCQMVTRNNSYHKVASLLRRSLRQQLESTASPLSSGSVIDFYNQGDVGSCCIRVASHTSSWFDGRNSPELEIVFDRSLAVAMLYCRTTAMADLILRMSKLDSQLHVWKRIDRFNPWVLNAVKSGIVAHFRFILNHHCQELNRENPVPTWFWDALCLACRMNSAAVVAELLEHMKSNEMIASEPHQKEETALNTAIRYGGAKSVVAVLSAGAKVDGVRLKARMACPDRNSVMGTTMAKALRVNWSWRLSTLPFTDDALPVDAEGSSICFLARPKRAFSGGFAWQSSKRGCWEINRSNVFLMRLQALGLCYVLFITWMILDRGYGCSLAHSCRKIVGVIMSVLVSRTEDRTTRVTSASLAG